MRWLKTSRWRPARLGFMLLVVAAALGLGACSDDDSGSSGSSTGGGGTPAEGGGQKLVMLDTTVAPSLDPDGASAADPALQQAYGNLMEPLLRYPVKDDGKGVLVPNYQVGADGFDPALATSWSMKNNVWTFKLRKGVKSCFGHTMTADDVVYTFERAKSVSGAANVAWFLGVVSNVFGPEAGAPDAKPEDKKIQGEIKKLDDYTVQIKQKGPNELFPRVLEIFALEIYDSKEMKAHATADDPWSHKYTDTENSPGFGPYCLTKWTKGNEMDFDSNPDYWQGKPKYTSIAVRQVPSESDRVAAVSSGQADIATSLTPKASASVAKSPQGSVLSWTNNKILGLGINYAYPPFNDLEKGKLIRQAIAYAMPYQKIIDEAYLGTAKKWNGLIESSYYGYKDITTYDTDIAKAKQLMEQAGYPNGQGLPKDSPAFKLNYVAERQSLLEPIAISIKTALSEIGIPVTLEPISQAEESTRELVKRDMGMFLRDYNRPLAPDVGYASLLWYVSKEGGGLEYSENWKSTEFDQLFVKSQGVTGDERKEVLGQMQEVLMQELPEVPIVESESQLAVKKGITGWFGNPYDLVYFWWLK